MAKVEMIIDSLRQDLLYCEWVVILKEKLGERYLPVYIASQQADIIKSLLVGTGPTEPVDFDSSVREVDINIASVAGLRPAESNGVYNIGKAGVIMLTQLLARQLAKYNIRVNAIAPGMIMTPMTEATLGNPEMRKRWENFIPLGHVGEANDIANAALFLASEASRHVTGHTMIIDGGQLLQYKYGL